MDLHEETGVAGAGNVMYAESCSAHKFLQMRIFSSDDGTPGQGEILRIEDSEAIAQGQPGFDVFSARPVIYRFRNGMLQSTGTEPAIEYAGHREWWNLGLIERVEDDDLGVVETWRRGIPVSIASA